MKRKTEVKKLYALSLRFGKFTAVVEKYQEAGPSLVCMICCKISYKKLGDYANMPAKFVICAKSYKVEEHQCGVIGFTKDREKIYLNIQVLCTNYEDSHIANFLHYTPRSRVGIKVNKERTLKK